MLINMENMPTIEHEQRSMMNIQMLKGIHGHLYVWT
jgi:hypothetical protein